MTTVQLNLFGDGVQVSEPPKPEPRPIPPKTVIVDYDPPDDLRSDLRLLDAKLPDGWQLVRDVDQVRLIAPEGFPMTHANSPPRMWFSRSRPIEVAIAEAERISHRIAAGTWSPYIYVHANYAVGREIIETWLEKWRAAKWKRPVGNNSHAEHLLDANVYAQIPEDLQPPREALERVVKMRVRRNAESDAAYDAGDDGE